jgi:hypothetical protein
MPLAMLIFFLNRRLQTQIIKAGPARYSPSNCLPGFVLAYMRRNWRTLKPNHSVVVIISRFTLRADKSYAMCLSQRRYGLKGILHIIGWPLRIQSARFVIRRSANMP